MNDPQAGSLWYSQAGRLCYPAGRLCYPNDGCATHTRLDSTMLRLLDRMILKNFLRAYVICFVSLLTLYVVVDLFNRLDDFVEKPKSTADMFARMGTFYSYQVVLISERLSSAIIFLAATFTLAWMQRNNEILLILSAGIPTRRILRPLLIGCVVMMTANLVNREYLLPQIAEQLEYSSNDPRGEGRVQVRGAYEPNDILISGAHAQRAGSVVKEFRCTIPDKIAGSLVHIKAKEARYIPPGPEALSGGWLMTETNPPELPQWKEPVLQIIDRGKFFLRTQTVDFELMTRTRNWHQLTSTWDLFRELQSAKSARFVTLAVLLHMRLTGPVLAVMMIWMGMSVLLKDQNRNVFINAGMCLVVIAIFYGLNYAGKFLGEAEFLSPALAAWLPVFVFGPMALVANDAIQT